MTAGRLGAEKAKSDIFAPLKERPEMVSGPVPGLLIVMADPELVVPTARLPKLIELGAADIPGCVPTPERGARLGLPTALLTMRKDALRLPVLPGLKTTGIDTVAFGATVMGTVCTVVKSAALVPVRVSDEIMRSSVPLFPMTRFLGALALPTFWLPKFSAVAGTSMTGTPCPLPVSVMECGLPSALSVKVMDAERAPTADGLKPTLMFENPPGFTVSGRVPDVKVKSV